MDRLLEMPLVYRQAGIEVYLLNLSYHYFTFFQDLLQNF